MFRNAFEVECDDAVELRCFRKMAFVIAADLLVLLVVVVVAVVVLYWVAILQVVVVVVVGSCSRHW